MRAGDIGVERVNMRNALQSCQSGAEDQGTPIRLRVDDIELGAVADEFGATLREMQNAEVGGGALDVDGGAFDDPAAPWLLEMPVRRDEGHVVSELDQLLQLRFDRAEAG